MAPLSKSSRSLKHLVQISGKRTIDQVNQDWRTAYEPNKRPRVGDPPAKPNGGVEGRPRKSCLKRKSDHADPGDGHDRPMKRVKIPKPDDPDVREFTKDGDPDFDFDLNRIFKGAHGPAFKAASDIKPKSEPKPVECRQTFGAGSKVISPIPGIGRKLAPLEQLPVEIRQQILSHLLGDRTLHIELGRGWKKKYPRAKRSYAVCRNPDIEAITRWHGGGYVPYKQCHVACCSVISPELYHPKFDRKLHLSILRASPLLYREGSAMLWSTNKFAFSNPQVFTDFIKCVGPAQSIRKLVLSDELVEGSPRQDRTWNRIIQQDEALLDWGLQGRNPRIMDALKSVEDLELHFHHVDHTVIAANGTEPPKYDEGLHNKVCSAFGDLRALEHVRTCKTHASMQIEPVTCKCVGPERLVFDRDDKAMRHLHAYRIPRVEESFNGEVQSPLGLQVIRNEEDFREQRRQIFQLRTEAAERQARLDLEMECLRILTRNDQRASKQFLVHRDKYSDRDLAARSRAHDAVSYKYELAYSLARDMMDQRLAKYERESKAVALLSADAEKRLKKLEERWGKTASEGLDLETFDEEAFDEDGDSESSSESD